MEEMEGEKLFATTAWPKGCFFGHCHVVRTRGLTIRGQKLLYGENQDAGADRFMPILCHVSHAGCLFDAHCTCGYPHHRISGCLIRYLHMYADVKCNAAWSHACHVSTCQTGPGRRRRRQRHKRTKPTVTCRHGDKHPGSARSGRREG